MRELVVIIASVVLSTVISGVASAGRIQRGELKGVLRGGRLHVAAAISAVRSRS